MVPHAVERQSCNLPQSGCVCAILTGSLIWQDLIAGKYRAKICAATMIGQGKKCVAPLLRRR